MFQAEFLKVVLRGGWKGVLERGWGRDGEELAGGRVGEELRRSWGGVGLGGLVGEELAWALVGLLYFQKPV